LNRLYQLSHVSYYSHSSHSFDALITGPCWLVPIPDSTGNTDANTRLCHMIANHLESAAGTMANAAGVAQLAKAIYRTQPVQLPA